MIEFVNKSYQCLHCATIIM